MSSSSRTGTKPGRGSPARWGSKRQTQSQEKRHALSRNCRKAEPSRIQLRTGSAIVAAATIGAIAIVAAAAFVRAVTVADAVVHRRIGGLQHDAVDGDRAVGLGADGPFQPAVRQRLGKTL